MRAGGANALPGRPSSRPPRVLGGEGVAPSPSFSLVSARQVSKGSSSPLSTVPDLWQFLFSRDLRQFLGRAHPGGCSPDLPTCVQRATQPRAGELQLPEARAPPEARHWPRK